MIQQGNIRSGIDMVLQQFAEVLGIHHIAGYDYHIRAVNLLNIFHIFQEGGDIIVIDVVIHPVLRKEDVKDVPSWS